MSNETEKIKKFIEKNQPFLAARNIDIAHSFLNDDWFVYCDNKEYHYYEYYIKFTTVKELVDILTAELTFELNCSIGEEPAPPACEAASIAEDVRTHYRPIRPVS